MYFRNLNASGLEQCVAECPSKGVEHDVKEVIRVAINVSFIATTTTATVITTCMYNLISPSLI